MISVILPPVMVKPITARRSPPGALTSAGAPSTMARLALAGEIDLAGRGGALHPAPGSAGKLPSRLRILPHDRADLVEGRCVQNWTICAQSLVWSVPEPAARNRRSAPKPVRP